MKSEKGQAMVEIALAIPILIFLMCGIVDFGRILYAEITINMVAQESVRYASLNKDVTTNDVEIFAKAKCFLSDKDSCLSAEKESDGDDYVKVTVHYTVNQITPIMKPIIGESFTVQTSSTIRVE